MTEVEKKIEEAAVFWCRDNQFDTHKDRGTSFKDGAHFGIQLVIDELRTNEEFYTSDGDYAQSFADILESKFKGKT